MEGKLLTCKVFAYCLLIVFVIVIGGSTGLLCYKEYKENLEERHEQRRPDLLFFEKNCLDPGMVETMKISTECHERFHRLDRSPEEYALYDLLQNFGMCGKDGCQDIKWVSYILEIIAAIVVALLALIYLCGYQISKTGMNVSSKSLLPFAAKKIA